MIYAIAGLNILGILSILIEKTERHAAQAPAPPACKHRGSLRAGSAARAIPQIFNLQSSIFNSGLPGLGVRQKLLFDGIRAFLNLIDQVLFVQRICQL